MAGAAFGLTSLGQSASDAARGMQEGYEYRDRRALIQQQQQLEALRYGLELQRLQEQIRQSSLPVVVAHYKRPDGSIWALLQDPKTGEVSSKQAVGPTSGSQQPISENDPRFQGIDETTKKRLVGEYQAALGASGNDPWKANQVLEGSLRSYFNDQAIRGRQQASQAATTKRQQDQARQRFEDAKKLISYRHSLTTGAPMTPEQIDDLAQMAERYGMDSISGIGAANTLKVKLHMADRGMAPAMKPNAAFEGQALQGQVIVQSGKDMLRLINDPDVAQWLGPGMGIVANNAMNLKAPIPFSGMSQASFDKLKGLQSARESFLLLQPQLHKARGKAMVDEFNKAVPDFRTPASAWVEQVQKLQNQAQRFVDRSGPRQQTGLEQPEGDNPLNLVRPNEPEEENEEDQQEPE